MTNPDSSELGDDKVAIAFFGGLPRFFGFKDTSLSETVGKTGNGDFLGKDTVATA